MNQERIELYLQLGNKYPYNDTAIVESPDWAHRAARGVVFNLMDRRGIKSGFNNIDDETRCNIVETLAAIIRLAATNQPATKGAGAL